MKKKSFWYFHASRSVFFFLLYRIILILLSVNQRHKIVVSLCFVLSRIVCFLTFLPSDLSINTSNGQFIHPIEIFFFFFSNTHFIVILHCTSIIFLFNPCPTFIYYTITLTQTNNKLNVQLKIVEKLCFFYSLQLVTLLKSKKKKKMKREKEK